MKNWPFSIHLTRDELVLVNAPLVGLFGVSKRCNRCTLTQSSIHLQQTVILVGKRSEKSTQVRCLSEKK